LTNKLISEESWLLEASGATPSGFLYGKKRRHHLKMVNEVDVKKVDTQMLRYYPFEKTKVCV